MNTVFSVDDLTKSFWPPSAPGPVPGDGMTRSHSEWAFQKLLEEISVPEVSPISSSSATDNAIGQSPSQLPSEPSVSRPEEEPAPSDIGDVVEIPKPQIDRRGRNRSPSSNPSHSVEIDPNHYQAILKSKLELACAAVALRVGTVKPDDSSVSSSGNQKQPPPIGSQTQGPVVAQMSPAVSLLGTQSKPDIQATSASSRDYSDDDDLDGDTETTENADPAVVKRAKRKISNRESARRSRRRKQEQMKELDTQVGKLRAEHSTLLKRLSDMNQKYDTAAVDNRILKADIETLRTKVKMAEETVKRVTGTNPLVLARPNSIPFSRTPTDSSQPNSNHILKPANPIDTGMIPNQRLANTFANNTVVPLNMSTVSNIGLKNSTKAPLALPSHLPEQVNPSVPPTSCNAYETVPHWNRAERNNKPQE